ncbi:hypothetical protein D3C78_1448310 [compost metagenome]
MALDKGKLADDLQEAFDFESDKDVNPAEARRRQAEKIANAFHTYITGGDVKTTVTGTSPSGAVTGTGTGKIE